MGWVIEETEHGTLDVLKDGRIVRYDEDDLTDAVEVVRRGGGTSYVYVEADGYRVTQSV